MPTLRNASTDHINQLLYEYVGLESAIKSLFEKDDFVRAELESNDRKIRDLVARQEQLTDVLAPAVRDAGAVYFVTPDGKRYAIADDANETTLVVTPLAPAYSLDIAPRFTAEEIREAAFHAAVEHFVTETWDDDDVVSLTGRHATIKNDANLIDQEVS